MQIELALSGFTQGLFFMMAALCLMALTALLLECLGLVFVATARFLWVKIRRDLAELSDVVGGKTPRKATVARIENGRKKFSRVAAGRSAD